MNRATGVFRASLRVAIVLLGTAAAYAAAPDKPSQPMPKLGTARILSSGELEFSRVPTPMPNAAEWRSFRLSTGSFWVRQNGKLLDATAAAAVLKEAKPVVFAELNLNQEFDEFYLQFFKPETIIVGHWQQFSYAAGVELPPTAATVIAEPCSSAAAPANSNPGRAPATGPADSGPAVASMVPSVLSAAPIPAQALAPPEDASGAPVHVLPTQAASSSSYQLNPADRAAPASTKPTIEIERIDESRVRAVAADRRAAENVPRRFWNRAGFWADV